MTAFPHVAFFTIQAACCPWESIQIAVAPSCCSCQESRKGSVGAAINFHAMLTLSASESVPALGRRIISG